jgi:hypothetical protein
MLASNIIPNNTSVIHLVETDNDHGDSMEDTLEAEISKLETTINDLEADNDLPDVAMCASDLEEGEILDSFLYEEKQSETSRSFQINLVTDKDGSNNENVFYNVDERIPDSEEKLQNMEYNNIDKHAITCEFNANLGIPKTILNTVHPEKDGKPNSVFYLANSSEPKTLQINDATNSPEPETASYQNCSKQNQKVEGRHETSTQIKPELNISTNKFHSSKSVIVSNDCEVSLQKCDFELSTNDIMVHLNSVNRPNIASTHTQYQDASDKQNEESSHKNSDGGVTRSSLCVDVGDDVVHETSRELYLELDASGYEDALLYDEDDDVPRTFVRIKDIESVVSSTPLKIKADTLKRWKPTFLSPNRESFLILDEFEELTDREQSVYSCINSPVQNKSGQKGGTPHSTKHKSLMCSSLLSKVNADSSTDDTKNRGNNNNEETEVAFDEAGDVKIVEQFRNEADDGSQASSLFAELSPVSANAVPIQGHGTRDIFVPMMEDRNMGTVNLKTTHSGTLTDQVSSHTKTATRMVTVCSGDNTNNIPEVNSLASNLPSESMNQTSLEQKQNVTSRNSDDYISNNPQENFDNNNPEWELLRKLETDEERYRAVRQRWRNLIIPDPNQDLTCHNWRIHQNANNVTASALSTNSDTVIDQMCASGCDVPASVQGYHKRSLSDEQASIRSQPIVKRPRTQSCTAVFDVKLEQLRRNIHYEKQRIYNQEQLALRQLNIKQIMERYRLQNRYHVHGTDDQMLQLYYQQRGVSN